MNNTIEYKGYVGSIEFSETDELFYGKVMGVSALISYEGQSAAELIDSFHSAIDDYLELCKARNIKAEKPYKGSFNVRVSPELHKRAAIYATAHHTTLNKFVANAMAAALSVQT